MTEQELDELDQNLGAFMEKGWSNEYHGLTGRYNPPTGSTQTQAQLDGEQNIFGVDLADCVLNCTYCEPTTPSEPLTFID